MNVKHKSAVAAVTVIAAVAGGGAAIAGATGGDDDATERPIGGAELDRAGAAALAETGGGEVTETETGDEEGAYEIEVTRADGSQVDVHLDADFKVLGSVSDDETDAQGED